MERSKVLQGTDEDLDTLGVIDIDEDDTAAVGLEPVEGAPYADAAPGPFLWTSIIDGLPVACGCQQLSVYSTSLNLVT